MYWCVHCYELNPAVDEPCVRCGRPVKRPAGFSYNDQLIWALGHPDGDRAALAAQTLGRRRVRAALPALRQAVQECRDPYLATAALRSAIEIAGVDELAPWLEDLTRCDSFMVRTVAQRTVERARVIVAAADPKTANARIRSPHRSRGSRRCRRFHRSPSPGRKSVERRCRRSSAIRGRSAGPACSPSRSGRSRARRHS